MKEGLKKLLGRPYKLGGCRIGGKLDCFGMIREYMYYRKNIVLPPDLKRDFRIDLKWMGDSKESITVENYPGKFIENPKEAMSLFETYLRAVFNGVYCFEEAEEEFNLGFEDFDEKRLPLTSLKKDDIVVYSCKGQKTQNVGIYLGFSKVMVCSEGRGIIILILNKDGLSPQRFYKTEKYCCEV